MPTYKVLKPCFRGGIYRTPGCPRHGLYVTDKPLDPVPSSLEMVKDETPTQRKKRTATAKKDADAVKDGKKESDVMFGSNLGNTTETL